MILMLTVVFCLVVNTFFTAFHEVDGEDSETTIRYYLGFIAYMTVFFIQTIILLGSYGYCVWLYVKLYVLLKPSKEALPFLTGN